MFAQDHLWILCLLITPTQVLDPRDVFLKNKIWDKMSLRHITYSRAAIVVFVGRCLSWGVEFIVVTFEIHILDWVCLYYLVWNHRSIESQPFCFSSMGRNFRVNQQCLEKHPQKRMKGHKCELYGVWLRVERDACDERRTWEALKRLLGTTNGHASLTR